MRHTGKLTSWNDTKGFGFIESTPFEKKIFVHISHFPKYAQRPSVGDRISFTLAQDNQGRWQAQHIRITTGKLLPTTSAGRALLIAIIFPGALCLFALFAVLPWFVPLWYAGMSLLTAVDYALDKNAAQKNRRRTPEKRLHLLALAGGWPGALYAMQSLRHKSAKSSFRIIFYLTVTLNLVGFGYWFYSGGLLSTEQADAVFYWQSANAEK